MTSEEQRFSGVRLRDCAEARICDCLTRGYDKGGIMSDYSKPLPPFTEETRKFWEGCKAEKLLIQRCRQCGVYQFYPRTICHHCLSGEVEWVESTGRGTVHTFTFVNRPYFESFDPDVPYAIAVIELEEGVRMLSNIIDCAPGEVSIGAKVKVVFDHVTPEITLPKFRLVKGR